MIDFVKLHTYDFSLIKELHLNELLQFSVPVGIRNGDILKNYQEAVYNGLTFKTYLSGRIEISGSLHKYWNKGEHNYNDFSFEDLKNVMAELKQVFGINPNTAIVNNFEYGLNITPLFCVSTLLNRLISCKNDVFTDMDVWKGRGKNIKRNNYNIKHYDKGLQHNLQQKIYRIEIAIKRMAAFHKCDGKTLYLINFLDADMPGKLLAGLQSSIDHTIFDEDLDRELTITERNIYDKVANPKYRPKSMTTKQRFDLKTNFNLLIDKHGTDKYRPLIHKLMLEKFTKLNNSSNVLTGVYEHKMERFDTSNIRSNHICVTLPIIRMCKTCGRDISEQKYNSKYCSELRFGKEAKKCRNFNSNPKNNDKNKLTLLKSRGLLFEVEPFIKSKVNLLTPYTRNTMKISCDINSFQ